MSRLLSLILLLLACTGCGYHVGGKGNLLPRHIQTIAVPAFSNLTTRYKLTDRLPADITRELIKRTRYRVVADPNEGDAVLTGAVINVAAYPTVLDPITNRSTGVQVVVSLQVKLVERTTGALLFSRPAMEFRERYELSVDPKAYFDESEPALQRMSRDTAQSVVSAILENF